MRKKTAIGIIICCSLAICVLLFGTCALKYEGGKRASEANQKQIKENKLADVTKKEDIRLKETHTDNEDSDAEKEINPSDYEDLNPLILIADWDTEDATRTAEYLSSAGVESEIVGAIEEIDVEKYDGIIIPGGNSVTPEMYGAEKQPETKNTNIEKDEFQFEAVLRFINKEKPVLGICRGEQLVNNVMGGTTIQHMPDGWHKKYREVTIADGSWLHDLLGSSASTYHYHHQCVDALGEGLYATQWDSVSGCIEAYEHESLPIYGLQWHPDSMHEDGVKVFSEFANVVRENMYRHQSDTG